VSHRDRVSVVKWCDGVHERQQQSFLHFLQLIGASPLARLRLNSSSRSPSTLTTSSHTASDINRSLHYQSRATNSLTYLTTPAPMLYRTSETERGFCARLSASNAPLHRLQKPNITARHGASCMISLGSTVSSNSLRAFFCNNLSRRPFNTLHAHQHQHQHQHQHEYLQ
jgi:hypothetical protein